MWSHYGANHRGICLGFDIDRTMLLDVIYADERVIDPIPKEAAPSSVSDELLSKLSRTKFRQWEYEGETRMMFP